MYVLVENQIQIKRLTADFSSNSACEGEFKIISYTGNANDTATFYMGF
jgi:hypothetical protein